MAVFTVGGAANKCRVSKLDVPVCLAATTQEGDDTAPKRDPTGPQEDNEYH